MDILFSTVFGSHLYGTDTPSSDLDFKGVYLPKVQDLILGSAQSTISLKRPKAAGEKNTSDDVDREYMSLQKFIKLACEGQMVAIDMLHASSHMWERSSDVWEELRARRHEFYSRNMNAFVGYARRQAAKYGVKGSRLACAREWLRLMEAGRELPMSLVVADAIECYPEGHHIWEHARPYPDPHNPTVCLEVVGKLFTGNAKAAHYASSLRLFVEEYGERARQAEANEGIDWKAMSHAVRAAYQVLIILRAPRMDWHGPELSLPLPMTLAQGLIDIKSGRMKFSTVAAHLEELMEEINVASAASSLPDHIDPRSFDDLVLRAYSKFLA